MMFYYGKEPSCNGLGLVGKHKALLILFNKPLKHVSPEQLPQTFHKGTTVSAFQSVFNEAVLQWIEQKGMETTIVPISFTILLQIPVIVTIPRSLNAVFAYSKHCCRWGHAIICNSGRV